MRGRSRSIAGALVRYPVLIAALDDDGVTLPIGLLAGVLLPEDDKDPISLRHFLANALRPSVPRVSYDRRAFESVHIP